MTQKEKAQDFFTEARFLLSLPNAPLGELKDEAAKEICKWRVNGILDALEITTGHLTLNHIDNVEVKQDQRFWQNVMKEIELL